MSRIVFRLFLLFALMGSVRVFATDGVVLINQASVLASGGFPFKITQPGSYKLSSNLIVPAGTDGIDVLADHVTLDMNGFGIFGPVACTVEPTVCPAASKGTGINAALSQGAGPAGVKVLNGSVHGMGALGIFMTGNGSLVDHVTVDSNAGGGFLIAGTVLASEASANGTFGIFAITVRDSTAVQNAGDGIDLDGSGGVASGNIASLNGGHGILVPNGTAIGNTVALNKSTGISAVCPSVIATNTLVANAGNLETQRDGCALANNATNP